MSEIEKLEEAVRIMEVFEERLHITIDTLNVTKREIELVIEENRSMKDENEDLEEERDKCYEIIDAIKKALEDT